MAYKTRLPLTDNGFIHLESLGLRRRVIYIEQNPLKKKKKKKIPLAKTNIEKLLGSLSFRRFENLDIDRSIRHRSPDRERERERID